MKRALASLTSLLLLASGASPAIAGEAVPASDARTAARVHVEANSPYYHRETCSWLHFGHPVELAAAARTRTPCPRCQPGAAADPAAPPDTPQADTTQPGGAGDPSLSSGEKRPSHKRLRNLGIGVAAGLTSGLILSVARSCSRGEGCGSGTFLGSVGGLTAAGAVAGLAFAAHADEAIARDRQRLRDDATLREGAAPNAVLGR